MVTSNINPRQFTVTKITESGTVNSYLHLHFISEEDDRLSTKLHDISNSFNFYIVNFLIFSFVCEYSIISIIRSLHITAHKIRNVLLTHFMMISGTATRF